MGKNSTWGPLHSRRNVQAFPFALLNLAVQMVNQCTSLRSEGEADGALSGRGRERERENKSTER